ncbi:metallopeptidase family protein [Lacibacterium aquatile]|uniref:Metallopeptidase family protein n=1 Tax=Lacibacterium aquatile TaxID=1168082 RepID=A0ABW5DQF8_9PROT
MMMRFTTPPSIEHLEQMARQAMATIPPALLSKTVGVVIQVHDFPDEETEEDMGLESPFDLLGLYRGVALTAKSFSDVRAEPDFVYLYRRPILDYWCDTGEDLEDIVRNVLIHEIGHHFGLSDEDMERLENEAD